MENSKILEALTQRFPKWEPQASMRSITGSETVFATENITGDTFDVIVNKEEGKITYRCNGKARGVTYSRWKKFFEEKHDKDILLGNVDFSPCIIRMSCSDKPEFMKVLAVASITDGGAVKMIPMNLISNFCAQINLNPMPIIYDGIADVKRMRDLLDKPLMGVAKDGLLISPQHTRPVVYIRMDQKINTDLEIVVKKDHDRAMELAWEFANNMMNTHLQEMKTEVFDEKDLQNYLNKLWSIAIDDYEAEYSIHAIQEEAGYDKDWSMEAMRLALEASGEKMMKVLDK